VIRVGVDAWNIPGDRRGIGRYVRETLRAWWNEMRDEVEAVLVLPEWHTLTSAHKYLRELDGRPYRFVSRRWHARAGLDVLCFPFNGCSWTEFTLPAVATLHDASNFVLPGYAPQTQRIFRAAAERCRELITVSAFSRDELVRELGVPAGRFTVVHEGVTPPLDSAISPPIDLAAMQPYAFYAGAAEERKGFDTLLVAMQLVRETGASLRLVTTAPVAGWRDMADAAGTVSAGYVNDAVLASLYRNCAVMAFPSRYEGFGLPVLEAMNYGAPVVCTSIPALLEVAGDAAVLVAPNDPSELAGAITRVAFDQAERERLRAAGAARVAQFSWSASARATLGVLCQAAGR
jgi:glycosyltransferase involved in cell wall biosynthesis